jgi:hypothetical protein
MYFLGVGYMYFLGVGYMYFLGVGYMYFLGVVHRIVRVIVIVIVIRRPGVPRLSHRPSSRSPRRPRRSK